MKLIWMSVCLLGISSCCLAQTCCTGGVPYLSALRIPQLNKNQIGFGGTYIFNKNSDIVLENESIDEAFIYRNVNTFLIQSDYGLSNYLSISILLPYLYQKEFINLSNKKNSYANNGLGDISVWTNYRNEIGKFLIAISFGLKFPTGNTTQKDPDSNILLPLSFQNGSGSFDFGFIGFISLYLDNNKKYKWNNQLSIKINTAGENFEVHPNYMFGHTFQFNSGISGEFIVINKLIDIHSGLNFEYQTHDIFEGGFKNQNTGGQWLNYYLGSNIAFTPRFGVSINGSVPIYRNLNGLQLTTSWLVNLGIGYIIG